MLGLIHHSDSQYLSSVTPNARRRPVSSHPSAAAVTPTTMPWPRAINGLYKAEVIHRRGPWRNRDAVEYATLEWVDWFNKRRLLEPIGNIRPAEFEAAYYRQQEESAMVA